MSSINKVVFIGAGNVATNLALAMHRAGLEIIQICSRTSEHAKTLALCVKSDYTDIIENVSQDADIYIIAVNDTALIQVCKQLRLSGKLVVHTSGFTSLEVLTEVSEHCGVFYPLQSFTKNHIPDMHDVPFCLESAVSEDMEKLEELARKISSNIRYIDSKKRKQLHLAAVFACNYSNFMYVIAEDILTKYHISFDLLKPLIIETATRIRSASPSVMQTGPARRNDKGVIKEHVNMLHDENYKELYQLLSELIINKYNND